MPNLRTLTQASALLLLATSAACASIATRASVATSCSSLTSLVLENTTILEAIFTPAGSSAPLHEQCDFSYNNTVDVCRVLGSINTTAESSTRFVAWLPTTWYGRFLFTGDGAFAGCMNYADLSYASSLHFASVVSDNGHSEGLVSGAAFMNSPEVIDDFSYRGAYASAVIGKQVAEAFYGSAPSKSYYMGCSGGGRQGFQFSLMYPDIFDGILAGAPAVNWNHIFGWAGMLSTYVGQPLLNGSAKYISPGLWNLITGEILHQCDGLDGLVDGIISDPDACNFDPTVLQCGQGSNSTNCLSSTQVNSLRQVYAPLTGTNGELIFPRFDPGAEADASYGYPMSGSFSPASAEWFQNAIYNDTNHSFDNFSMADIYLADSINPGGIATWNGNLSAFRDKGGKLLTFHGTRDSSIAHGNSERLYNMISTTLSQSSLDPWYRLFLVPGMGHCAGGLGQWMFGQGASLGTASVFKNDTTHNILLAMVNWVENGVAPDYMIGGDANSTQRMHCRYPQKSHWNGVQWVCVQQPESFTNQLVL